ncbi:MAG: hypothetical protein AWU58_739 [Methanohalophilus sp. T328-1]|nr:MAG: hypothetical protein AWU58_739 [Methanohalophilus sp. T328-1]
MDDIEVEFEDIGQEEKEILLNILGYYVDDNGTIFNKETNEEHICPMTKETVSIKNASILPGSTVIINTTELTLSEYFMDYFEKLLN